MSQPDDRVGAEDGGAAAATRDWAAFAEQYDLHAAHLFRVARLLLAGNPALVEDAVADTFVKVHRSWSEGKVEHFLGYAQRTLVNHVMGMFRKQQIAERYLPLLSGQTDVHQDVASAVVDADAALSALAALPGRRRTTIVLRYYEDLPYDEIADLMQISIGAVKAHVFAGLQQLRERLGGGSS